MNIIFTGANYWKVNELPGKIESDFKLISGYRWIKAQKQFSKTSRLFPCPKHYQKLSTDEAQAQGLI